MGDVFLRASIIIINEDGEWHPVMLLLAQRRRVSGRFACEHTPTLVVSHPKIFPLPLVLPLLFSLASGHRLCHVRLSYQCRIGEFVHTKLVLLCTYCSWQPLGLSSLRAAVGCLCKVWWFSICSTLSYWSVTVHLIR